MKSYLVHQYLKHRATRLDRAQQDPLRAQERLFQRLKRQWSGTEAYETSSLTGVETYYDFCARGRRQTYQDWEKLLDRQIAHPETSVLFRDSLTFVGLSSGTTLETSKRIPINAATLRNFKRFQFDAASLLERNFGHRLARDAKITWGSVAVVESTAEGIPSGFISGFLSHQPPKALRKLSYPSKAVCLIADLEEKAKALAKETRSVDIRILSGVPTYLLQLCEILKREFGVTHLREVWPNLKTIVYSATPIEPYREALEQALGGRFQSLGIYVSTEGPLGMEESAGCGYSLNFKDVLFSFRRLTDPEDAPLLGVHELKAGDEVEVCISGPQGFRHYSMGDCLRVLQAGAHPRFEIIGREGQGINVAAEKVSLKELETAILRARAATGARVRHHFTYPGHRDSRPCYEWTVLVEDFRFDLLKFVQVLDETLKELNEDYLEARERHDFLGAPICHFEGVELAERYFVKFSHRGQLKMKTAFPSKEEFWTFVEGLRGAA